MAAVDRRRVDRLLPAVRRGGFGRHALTQSLFVAYIGAFGLLTMFGNITDYGSNFAFVQHVMSMDTIFSESRLRYRAITRPVARDSSPGGFPYSGIDLPSDPGDGPLSGS